MILQILFQYIFFKGDFTLQKSARKAVVILQPMKTYVLLMVFLTIAEVLFTLIYFFIRREPDEVIIAGLFIYLAGIISCTVAYMIAKDRRKKKQMLDELPSD